MKKVLSVLLTVCMLFMLPGCNGSESAVSSSSVNDITLSDLVSGSDNTSEIQTSQADEHESAETSNQEAESVPETAESTSAPETSSSHETVDETSAPDITEPPQTSKPAETTGATETVKPAETAKPVETTKPAATTKPVTSSKPAETTRLPETTVTESSQPQIPAAKTLVVYFSCTGNTKSVAEKIADICSADIYEIVPAEPYTSDDLNYNDDNCRANREMNDENARPEIGSQSIDLSGYDTVFIGYPIWWGTMPRIINTFLDTYDLSGKTVMPFCTSGGSGVSRSVSDIRSAEPNADVRSGLRANGANDSGIETWISDNNIG